MQAPLAQPVKTLVALTQLSEQNLTQRQSFEFSKKEREGDISGLTSLDRCYLHRTKPQEMSNKATTFGVYAILFCLLWGIRMFFYQKGLYTLSTCPANNVLHRTMQGF